MELKKLRGRAKGRTRRSKHCLKMSLSPPFSIPTVGLGLSCKRMVQPL